MFKNKLDKDGVIIGILFGICGYMCFSAGKSAGAVELIKSANTESR